MLFVRAHGGALSLWAPCALPLFQTGSGDGGLLSQYKQHGFQGTLLLFASLCFALIWRVVFSFLFCFVLFSSICLTF